ncbi:hypothetical protein GOP47_0025870 [Adiantum capillus-veneris]|uniref:Uncharacterized protein n=1 Tax=Adiantum capillus-veneris TaxID=13818 RepID=A0A9D4U3M2_ADICA|nr:hypothetical protein GOP47_0025870 [Adiantum capillus-veneris]
MALLIEQALQCTVHLVEAFVVGLDSLPNNRRTLMEIFTCPPFRSSHGVVVGTQHDGFFASASVKCVESPFSWLSMAMTSAGVSKSVTTFPLVT